MQLIRSILFIFLMYLMMLVLGIIFLPAAIYSPNGAYFAVQFYCRRTLGLARVLCGLSYEIRGTIPQDEVVVASKHQSFMDIIILAATLPRFKFIMKKELKWAPVLGFYAMRMGMTPVDRGKKSVAMQDMIDDMEAKSDNPGQIVIYPQGTRVPPGENRRYKVGAGVLYMRFGLPAIPAATNVGVFWPKRGLLRKPGCAVLEFLDPIPPGRELESFMKELEETVEARSNALMRDAGFDIP